MLGSESSKFGFLERIGRVLLAPKEQIRQIIHEQRTVLEPVLLACLVAGVLGALSAAATVGILSSFMGFFSAFSPQFAGGVPSIFVAGGAIAGVSSVLIDGMLVAAIMHLAAKVLGGQGFYLEAVRAVFYSFLPYGFLAIPLAFTVFAPLPAIILASGLGTLAFVWQLYVLFESIREIYGTSGGKTLAVLLSPLVVALVIAALALVAAYAASGGATV